MQGDIQLRCRYILRQACNSLDIQIIKEVVSKEHIHLHLGYPPNISISEIVRRLKGRSSRLLMQEFPELKRRYLGSHFWGIGYGCWSTGHITEDMLASYLSHHKDNPIQMILSYSNNISFQRTFSLCFQSTYSQNSGDL